MFIPSSVTQRKTVQEVGIPRPMLSKSTDIAPTPTPCLHPFALVERIDCQVMTHSREKRGDRPPSSYSTSRKLLYAPWGNAHRALLQGLNSITRALERASDTHIVKILLQALLPAHHGPGPINDIVRAPTPYVDGPDSLPAAAFESKVSSAVLASHRRNCNFHHQWALAVLYFVLHT